eukprot:gb/GFBE01059001.1/.p1 GENE.gb/GFBE01059001.1/~~gb/GFBE01059001.1/.p1  ORF type:complete len:373 (+),score=38.73 gb/GFBE01059001.1/:1-1119(+)
MDKAERQCRICMSQDDDSNEGLGRLVEPCNCRGSMRYVHTGCLRSWRLKQRGATGWSLADVCSVCRGAYRCDALGQISPVQRLILTYPVGSFVTLSTVLLWFLLPWLHRHLGGAAWMLVASPLHGRCTDCFQPLPWENGHHFRSAALRWLLSAWLSLLLPAAFNHFTGAFGSLPGGVAEGQWLFRISEAALLGRLLQRLRFLYQAAAVRSLQSSARGRWTARLSVSFWQNRISQLRQALRRTPSTPPALLADAGVANLSKPATKQLLADAWLLSERSRVEISIRSFARHGWVHWWLDVALLRLSGQRAGLHTMVRTMTLSMVALSWVKHDLRRFRLRESDVLIVLCNSMSLLCSMARSVDALRCLALRLAGP